MVIKALLTTVYTFGSISAATAASFCIDRPAAEISDIFIYTGTREAALNEINSDDPYYDDETAATYLLYNISNNDLISYFLADSFKFRTPKQFWQDTAYKFEHVFDDAICTTVVDNLELYLQVKSSDSFVVRRLQSYERDRILKNLRELKTVF